MTRAAIWMVLRNYQAADVERIVCALRTVRRVLYVLPTGAGKTHVAQAVAAAYPGARVLIVSHRREIVQQTAARFGDGTGVIMRGVEGASAAPVQVASIQSLIRREAHPPADLLILDEAHHAEAATWRKLVVELYPDAKVLGLTATPWTKGGRGLAGAFDEMVVGRTVAELVEAKWLTAPRAWTHGEAAEKELAGELAALPSERGDWNEAALERVMNRKPLVGSLVEHYKRLGGGHRAVAYATGLKHARAICEEFRAAGITAEYLDGETPLAERAGLLARLRAGETRVVVNYGVLTEGWDMPEAKVCVCARPTRSLTLWLQMVGRFLRPWDGVTPVILDHAGNVGGLGMPQDAREYSLEGRTRRRGAGGPVWKMCPACTESSPAFAQVCPCGHRFFDPAAAVEGGLVEVRERVCVACGTGYRLSRNRNRIRRGGGTTDRCVRCVRSEAMRKANAARTPEQRSEASRKANAAQTPEQRSEAMRKARAAQTPEQRSEAMRKANAAQTPEQRSEASRKANAARTPEQRSEASRKAWATRREPTE